MICPRNPNTHPSGGTATVIEYPPDLSHDVSIDKDVPFESASEKFNLDINEVMFANSFKTNFTLCSTI